MVGRSFRYDNINHDKVIAVDKGTSDVIIESINLPGRLMRGILSLFADLYNMVARDTEKLFKPDITKVKVSFNGIPSKVYTARAHRRGT